MLRRIPKVLLLVALLAAFAASSIPAFGGSSHCHCFRVFGKGGAGGCHFDQKTSQCVITTCNGACILL